MVIILLILFAFALSIAVVCDIIETRRANKKWRLLKTRRRRMIAALPDYPYCISFDKLKELESVTDIAMWMMEENVSFVSEEIFNDDLSKTDVLVLNSMLNGGMPGTEYHFKDQLLATEFKLLFG